MSNAATKVPPTLAEAIAVIERQQYIIESLQRDLQLLRGHLNQRLREMFGRSSERFEDPNQLGLFGELVSESRAEKETPPKQERDKKQRKRAAFGEGLRREENKHGVPEELELCTCCDPPQEMAVIGYETTETLEIVPPDVFVKADMRPKLACPKKQGDIITPLVEPRVLPKARVGVSMLVYILLAKYQDHLPLYRIHKALKRLGARVPESTLCDWVGGVTDVLAPLVLLMKKYLLQQTYLQADETPAKARDPNLKGKHATVYFWVYGIPWKDVVFDFRKSRQGSHPLDFLEGWNEGRLQVDDYRGYDELFRKRNGLTRVGCMAHARRKFKEAKHDQPQECTDVMRRLQWIFGIETLMRDKGRSPDQRKAIRQRFFVHQFREMLEQIDEGLGDPTVLPKSPYEKAIRYAKNNWQTLTEFLEDGELEMDNNGIENAIRPFAIGRKNWMHIGDIDAGDRAAVMYSLLTTCERLGINAHDYLTDVLNRIPTHPIEDQWELTPRGWLEARVDTQEEESSLSSSLR